MLRILIVNTSEQTGGAAVAACRLMNALNNNGVKAKLLVREKETDSLTVVGLPRRPWLKWPFLWERLMILCRLHFRWKGLFSVDTASSGFDITSLPEFKEADVVHLHWINQGMLSLKGIRKILRSGKPVVWTMHDMWPATALCHLTMGCRNFTVACQSCKYLPGGGSRNDLAAKVWRQKQRLLDEQTISFVACSRWLEDEARHSALLSGQTITNIPNPIDTRQFSPDDRQLAREAEQLPQDKRLMLFVCQNLSHANKGMDYLIEACNMLTEKYPEMRDQLGVVLLGGHADEMAEKMPFATFPIGYISDEERIIRLYRAADVFVLPSLSENLPNTIMEAMACGVPCVAFRVGGIPEEIDHMKNGYLAQYRSIDDLARGIRWTLYEADRDALGREAVKKVVHSYSQTSVSMRYIEVYQHAIAQRHFNL